jgi:hypothetical protein
MSNRSERRSQDSLLEAIRFALDRFKVGLWTAGPGHIQSYDPNTRRAVVIPAIRRKFTDGTTEALPMLHNVPVLHPSGGGFSLLFPLRKGDPVLLVWCQRGIDRFKETYAQEDPSGGIMELKDAVALAGFGELVISPENAESAVLQTNTGKQALSIHPNKVRIVSDNLVRVETVQAEVIASESVLIDSPLTRHTGIVEAAGYRGVGGGAAKMVADIDMDGHQLTNASELTAGGVRYTTHVHDGDSGGVTSAPKEG